MAQGHAGPVYWRSLDELADTPEFRRLLADEFPGLAEELERGGLRGTRRQFLKLMGASFALAGLTGCRWPKENIVPATRQPGNRIPGVPVSYATAYELSGVATGVLVTSYDGRPIKIEGNDKHPFSRGKTNAWMQASLLDLYDPDRSQQPAERTTGPAANYRSWDEFRAFASSHFAALRDRGGKGLSVFAEPSSSPSRADLKARLLAACPEAHWYEYEPCSRDHEREATRLALGRPYRPHFDLVHADLIVSLDSDFLMMHPAAVRYAGDFAARRRADDGAMNRLWVFESNLTVTGSNADHRHPVQSADIGNVLRQIIAALAKITPAAESIRGVMAPPGRLPLAPAVAERVARDLAAHHGRAVLTVGPQQPPAVHAEALLVNQRLLGACGTTLRFTEEPEPDRPSHLVAIAALTERMRRGEVDTLLILGGNPAYDAPADLDFVAALAAVATSVHLSMYNDETSQRCAWHVPRAHYLESWGDARAYDGTLSLVQPLIEPLYAGLTPLELLAVVTGDALTSGYDIVRRTWGESFDFGADRHTLWEQALHDGVVADTAWPWQTPELQPWPAFVDEQPAEGWEVVFTPDYSVYDGRFANNAWLQELPDPLTKLTWDNAALLAPADARRLGIEKSGDMVRVEVPGGRALELPVCILPGHAENSITLPLGYGRRRGAGVVAEGVGFNAFVLRPGPASTGGSANIVCGGVRVAATGKHYALATTQDHHAIRSAVGDAEEQQRIGVLVRETTVEHYRQHPDFAQHTVHLPKLDSLWKEKEYKDHKWGMAIDLNACIGCSACTLACQAENNIPVVGKEEVARGREMHWIRVDRYFRSDPDSAAPPAVVHQPVTCVHCENAPCEQVCPVAATVHDEEGLNVMVYNRCIGTRYCSNNCPFKVRRFNWFYNHHGPYHPRSTQDGAAAVPGLLPHAKMTPIEMLAHNPSVTVRSRGVMEKCTFCVQRINAVKITARNEHWTSIPDGLITPACAQACPTSAIVFGDLNDPNSRVARLHNDNRAYGMLEELNIKPRTRYLAKLRNPGPGGDAPPGPAHS